MTSRYIAYDPEFSHVSLEERRNDVVLVKNRESQYRWIGTERGRILESFLIVELGRCAWLGDADVFRTAKFDDIINGVDLVLEWLADNEDDDPIRLAVDLTTSMSHEGFQKKIQKMGLTTRVKYYRSENTDDSSITVPLVVLGIDADLLQEVAKFAESHRKLDRQSGRRTIPKQTFAKHPLKYLLLEQAVCQLSRAPNSGAKERILLEWQRVQEEMKDPEISKGILAFKRRSVLHKVLTTGRLP